ncbi:PREDICTED: uncharacterized protein LOC105460298 [Wasmannia auropunctata]|uniref:uncharacterized protein LOC105460298 n=1 Tax=Wasmannia auropunctata TaxID=64793 RepID=UPI0005ED8661|nr:PREDICTED: uncharacterized protein LOC105460298 [Wasmannia auropunctata]
MQILKEANIYSDLNDADGSIKLCKRVNALITAMNNRTPKNSLQTGNEMYKNIEDFLTFLVKWEKEAKIMDYSFITEQTCYGLKISLKVTLEICSFLIHKCGFQYLMTARLNQDNLERFFGMMRSCCGCNDHPDSQLYIQTYRLISTYSLVKPPKGCNVSSEEIMNVLLNIKDIADNKEREEQWIAQIDTVLDRGRNTDVLAYVPSLFNDHNSHKCTTSDYVLTYIAGYVARKGKRFCKGIDNSKYFICQECLKTLVLQPNNEIPERHKLIEIKSKGYLINPFVALFNLLSTLEKGIIETTQCGEINANTLFEIMDLIDDEKDPVTLLGCVKQLRIY